MPKAFSAQEKQTIQTRLLEEGRKQFATFGLTKTRVEELSTAAGISKGAFYNFYASKEALFMDVVEAAEKDFQREVLASLELPGPSPHARLYTTLHTAFTLWKTIPILRIFTQADYAILARRIPPETFQAHLQSDSQFIEALIARGQQVGIPIQVQPAQLGGLLHTLFFASLHEDDFGVGALTDALKLLLHLTVAYCLGDVKLPAEA